ncbi:MAG: 30S ribosomal protein S16 [Candidatus Aminicenantales bacterium]
MLSMRLMRFGAKKKAFYRIVVIDSRRPRESKAVDYLGYYNPLKDPAEVRVDLARAKSWLARGVQASKTVQSLLERAAQSADATE